RAQRDETLVLFYAGHGRLDRRGRLCLATADTDDAVPKSSSIRVSALGDLIRDSECQSVILLLDCCYSGAVEEALVRGDAPSEFGQMATTSGLHVFTATSAVEVA